ncbi:MAG: nicotinate-nucleotide--dimethylbenzimidazole phosphoribosyltransferase [Myxococcaceae bacterium]
MTRAQNTPFAGAHQSASWRCASNAPNSTALDVGVHVANTLIDDGADLLITGDMGIGNTTASAALIAALTGEAPHAVVGRGAGANDAQMARKLAAISKALSHLPKNAPVLATLAALGGFEHPALAGFVVGGAARRVPVVVDGVITGAALLVASALDPGVEQFCIAGHRSVEPGASIVLEKLKMRPLLDLEMRLGERTGALTASLLVVAASRLAAKMAFLDDARIDPT